ncbi:hypothetical protein ACSBR1_036412 [Camellia fascicularis]
MAQGGNRGWIPVVWQRERGGVQGKEVKHGLFTLFVDNSLSAMDAKTLSKLFTQFGIVKDVFIPFKRRTVSNSRFGFVRFDCLVSADIAIQKANGLSFTEVLKGVTPTVAEKTRLIIKANEEGNGWLYDSAIVRLNSEYSTISIENVLKEKGGTFNNIGSIWGTVLSLDGDTCQPKSFSHTRIRVATSSIKIINKNIFLECKGKLHPILVCKEHLADLSIMKHDGLEKCSSNEICGSGVEGTIPEECYREKEEISVMETNTVLEESKCDGVFSGEEEACSKEVEQRTGSGDCHLKEEVNTVVEETMLEESVHGPKINVEQAFTPGFPRSFSGSRDGHGHGINLEVDLAQALSMNLNRKRFLSLNHLGLGSFARLHGHKAAAVSKHTSKSVIFRPAAAAIARSDLSEGVASQRNLLLHESKTTLQLGKSLGINFNGK